MVSILTRSMGVYVAAVNPKVWMGILSWFIFWQHSQCLMKDRTFSFRWGIGFVIHALTFAMVRETPWWPVISLWHFFSNFISLGVIVLKISAVDAQLLGSTRVANTAEGCMTVVWSELRYWPGVRLPWTSTHSLLKLSAILLCSPGRCSTSALYSCVNSFQRRTLSDAQSFMKIRFLWSVFKTKGISRMRCLSFKKQ